MTRKIKFLAHGQRWFDKVNGNTYHSVKIVRLKDDAVITCPFQYGYDDAYQETALKAMAENKWLPPKYRKRNENGMYAAFNYERENNYPIAWSVSDGLKRDCIANGKQ